MALARDMMVAVHSVKRDTALNVTHRTANRESSSAQLACVAYRVELVFNSSKPSINATCNVRDAVELSGRRGACSKPECVMRERFASAQRAQGLALTRLPARGTSRVSIAIPASRHRLIARRNHMPLMKCSECGRQVSDRAQACPNCGAPITAAQASQTPQPSSLSAAQLQAKKGSSDTTTGCLGCLGLFVILLIVGTLCPSSHSGSSTSDHDGTMAEVMCEKFMKNQLRAPATADFSSSSESATPMGNDKFVVRGYVDAQNGFGANIRTNYVCTVQYTGGANWRLLSLTTSP